MTMTPLQCITTHFSSKEVKEIVVPEWIDQEGNPLKIYAMPMTLEENQKLYNLNNNKIEGLVDALILKAIDGQGNKMFTLKDKQALMTHADPNVLSRVVTEIFGSDDVEATKKN